MLIDSSIPRFPPPRLLRRFFRAGRSASIHPDDAAALLGMTPPQVLAMAEGEGTLLPDGMLPWEEVAHKLFLAWPRVRLLAALGPDDAHRIPTLFFPMRLPLQVPLYLHLAMQHQASGRGLDDYVSDILHERVEDGTLVALRKNEAFVEAFYYPEGKR